MHFKPLLFLFAINSGCSTTYQVPESSLSIRQRVAEEIATTPPRAPSTISLDEALTKLRNVNSRVQSQGALICQHLNERISADCRSWDVKLSESNDFNAYAYGDNAVVINLGVLKQVANDDELALVLSHEMAHHILNHGFEDTVNASLASTLGAILGGILTSSILAASGADCTSQSDCDFVTDMISAGVDAGMSSGAELGLRSFSKSQETEADLVAAYIISLSGYSLIKAREFLIQLAKLDDSGRLSSNFSDTHPVGPARVANFGTIIDEVLSNSSRRPQR